MSRPTYPHITCVLIVLVGAFLSGCVAETPTPSLVDPTGFVTYTHPTGVFSLDLPPDWIVGDTSDAYALNVSFSPPGSPEPSVSVYVVSVDTLDVAEFNLEALGDIYQATFYDAADTAYKEISRDLQPDGSLRVKFVLDAPQGTTQHNDFLHLSGPYFAVLRITLPDDQAQLRTIGLLLNTFKLNPQATWASAVAGEAEGASQQDVVGFVGLNAWVDRNGGFEIVGQIVNNADYPLEFVRINAQLYDAENRLLVEQDDFVSSDLVLPGEYTPFSLVFGDGMPPGMVRYDLHASARYADYTVRSFYGPDNFALTSQAEFDENGLLVISGQVRNEGSLTATLVKVIVTIFDADQRVIGTDTTLVDIQHLAPGEMSTFSLSFVELGGIPNTFLVTAQGIIQE